jgi:cyclopropane fatty-acyl-phospholipid synthase-like methyltransferase
MQKQEIIDYYEYTRRFYKYFWHGASGGIHYGFWDKETKNHQEALLNTNKTLAEKAHIGRGDRVLDAGCGVGGSAIWLAKQYGCEVVGITISPNQVRKARETATKEGVRDLVQFEEQDFIHTSFEDESFDVVWGIESVCYAEVKKDFLREAYRLLKPTGRLIISDGFLLREPRENKEQESLNNFLVGLAVPNLSSPRNFEDDLRSIGFKNISSENKTGAIMPEAKRIYRMSRWSYPLSKLTEKLGLTSPILRKNNLAGIAQLHIIKNGIMAHMVFYAEK